MVCSADNIIMGVVIKKSGGKIKRLATPSRPTLTTGQTR